MTPELNLYDLNWPIWTYPEQLPPAKFVFDEEGRRGVAIDSMVSGGCIISGATVRRSVLFSNVWVGEGAILKKVVIDRGCNIPAGMSIGVNPAEDAKRFHVSGAGVTLVTPEMLGQNMHIFR